MKKRSIWHRCHLSRLLAVALAVQVVMVALPPPVWAASGTVAGTLVDANGQPLRNAVVSVRDDHGSTVATGVTDENGEFSITDEAISAGSTYNVCAAAGCSTVVALAPPAGALAGLSTTGLIAIGVGVAGATGVSVGVSEAVGGGGTEGTVSRSR